MRELTSYEITSNILEQTPVIFVMIKEGVMEVLEECFGNFHSEMVALMEARTLTFY